MALTFTVNGAVYTVGVERTDVACRLGRKPIYRKFATPEPDFVGKVGQTIQFTNHWEPNAILPGITDNVALPLRDPTIAARTVQLLCYGEGREWSVQLLERSPSTIERAIREGLADTVARSINLGVGTAMRATNVYYWPLGAPGTEAYGMNYAATWPVATATRLMTEADLVFFGTVAGINGWKLHKQHGGMNVVVRELNREALLRRMQAFALAGPPKSLEQISGTWDAGQFVAWLHGSAIWYDNTADVLRSGLAFAGGVVGEEAFFFGENPLVEACVHKGVQMSTYTSPDSRFVRVYMYEDGVGWTLQVNNAGVGAVPPADINSTCLGIFGDA